MPIDAGSISSSVRINLAELNADISACKTAFDSLGGNLAASATNYANITGKQYFSALKKIQSETDNITAATKAGALTEQQSISRLIQLRQQELAILQKRAISEAGSNKDTVAAIKNTQTALTQLVEKQKLLGGETEKTSAISQKLGSMLTFAGATAAVAAVIGAIKKSVEAFAEAEVSAQRLDLALKMNGMGGSRKALTGLADDLQNLMGIDGDYVKQLEAELVAQGRSEQQIKDLITAAAGLSSVTGDDLSSSLEQLNKMYEGVTPRSSALKAITEGLTEAQLRNGEGIQLVKTKYEGYIGAVGTTKIANDRLKESFGDYLESIGRGFATATSGAADAASKSLALAAKARNAEVDGQEAIIARKKGTATIDQQILAIEALMLNNATKISKVGYIKENDRENYFKMTAQIEDQKQAIERLNKTSVSGAKEQIDLEKKKTAAKSELLRLETAVEKISSTTKKHEMNKELLVELNYWQQQKKSVDNVSQALSDLKPKQDGVATVNEELKKIQEEYNKAIEQSIQNQRESGDDQGGLNERITLTKEYIKNLIKQGESTTDARNSLAGYEYQLGSLKNIDKMAQVEKIISEMGLSTDQLKAKQREQAIADIQNGDGSQASKDDLIAQLKEQYELEDKLAKKENKISGIDSQISKIGELKGATDEYIDSQEESMLAMADSLGIPGPALEALKDKIKSTFSALKDSKSAAEFKKNLENVKDVAGKVTGYLKDFLGALDDMIQNSYDKQIDSAKEAADIAAAALEEKQKAERAALDAESAHALELLEYDGLTKEEYLQKQVDDAIAAGDAEAQAAAEKELLIYQTTEDYAKKKDALDKKQAADKKAADDLAAKQQAQLEYSAALASWKIKVAMSIADAAMAVLSTFAETPGDLVIKSIAAAAAGVIGGVQVAAVYSAQPTPPKLATGGIVLPSGGGSGTPVIAGDRGGADIMFGTSAMGQPLMKEFAKLVASEVGQGGGTIVVQSVLDGKIVATSTAQYFLNGNVRYR